MTHAVPLLLMLACAVVPSMVVSIFMGMECDLPQTASWDALEDDCSAGGGLFAEPACTLWRLCQEDDPAKKPYAQICDLQRIYATLCKAVPDSAETCAAL